MSGIPGGDMDGPLITSARPSKDFARKPTSDIDAIA